MKCPYCRTQAVIKKTEEKTENNEKVNVLHFFCRNRKCSRYETEVGEEKNRI